MCNAGKERKKNGKESKERERRRENERDTEKVHLAEQANVKIMHTLSPFGLPFQVEVVFNETQVESISLVSFKRLYIMRFLPWWES